METPRRQVRVLVLCLLLRNICCQVPVEVTVDIAVSGSVTLPCSFTIPSNLKEDELQVIWFKNFTEKLWDCTVKSGKAAECGTSPGSSRTQILRKGFGNVDLEISALQESDTGLYQCWIILSDTYRRRDVLLRVSGGPQTSSLHEGVHKDPSAVVDSKDRSWGLVVMVYSWSTFLLGGWPVALFLAGMLWIQRCNKRKRKAQLLTAI